MSIYLTSHERLAQKGEGVRNRTGMAGKGHSFREARYPSWRLADQPAVVHSGVLPFLAHTGNQPSGPTHAIEPRRETVRLSTISDEARRPEDEFWAEFEAVRPHILGAALDAVSTALRNIGSVRLADFLKWVIPAVPVLGFEPGDFETAYRENRRDVSEIIIRV